MQDHCRYTCVHMHKPMACYQVGICLMYFIIVANAHHQVNHPQVPHLASAMPTWTYHALDRQCMVGP